MYRFDDDSTGELFKCECECLCRGRLHDRAGVALERLGTNTHTHTHNDFNSYNQLLFSTVVPRDSAWFSFFDGTALVSLKDQPMYKEVSCFT